MSEIPERKLLVVFDIDETLLQFTDNRPEIMKNVESRFQYKENEVGKSCIIFRPHIQELFRFFSANKSSIRVALWTYSDKGYADYIADELIEFCGLDPDFFLFVYSIDEIEDDTPKKLSLVWDRFSDFNKFNSFLVDDRAANLYHDNNLMNSIIIQPFIPFGALKIRVITSQEHLDEQGMDNAFLSLQKICETILGDIRGCEDEDIRSSFRTESIFIPKRLTRMGLSSNFKTYARKHINMMTIGTPEKTNNFIPIELPHPSTMHGGKMMRKNRTRKFIKIKINRKSRKYMM